MVGGGGETGDNVGVALQAPRAPATTKYKENELDPMTRACVFLCLGWCLCLWCGGLSHGWSLRHGPFRGPAGRVFCVGKKEGKEPLAVMMTELVPPPPPWHILVHLSGGRPRHARHHTHAPLVWWSSTSGPATHPSPPPHSSQHTGVRPPPRDDAARLPARPGRRGAGRGGAPAAGRHRCGLCAFVCLVLER